MNTGIFLFNRGRFMVTSRAIWIVKVLNFIQGTYEKISLKQGSQLIFFLLAYVFLIRSEIRQLVCNKIVQLFSRGHLSTWYVLCGDFGPTFSSFWKRSWRKCCDVVWTTSIRGGHYFFLITFHYIIDFFINLVFSFKCNFLRDNTFNTWIVVKT